MRMPTVTELYQAITTGTVLTVPNSSLKPEHADSYELSAQHKTESGLLRLTFFQQKISNALLSQSAPLLPSSDTLFSFVQNVDRTRARGAELIADQYDAFISGLELSGNLTAVDARIVRDTAFANAVNKRIPQLPVLRANLLATYRPDDVWAFTLGARYSDRSFGTIDNSDPVSQTYQGFAGFLVFDTRVRYRVDGNWTLSAGIDNLNGDKYFLFHPFPQRTFVMEIHYAQ
jgi:iron complex outermembrane receptor protein